MARESGVGRRTFLMASAAGAAHIWAPRPIKGYSAGEMRALLNRVIEAQKEAEANVILRREETAATRSLAQTAKVLAENPLLVRLKELEAYKATAKEEGYPSMSAWARQRLNEASGQAIDEPSPEASPDASSAGEGDG